LTSLFRLVVLLLYPFNPVTTVSSTSSIVRRFKEGDEGRRDLSSRWRPTDPGYLFAQGASHGEALLVHEVLSPPSLFAHPFLVPPSSGCRLQRLRERKPSGHSSLRPALLRALSLTPFTTKRATLNASLSVLHFFPKRFFRFQASERSQLFVNLSSARRRQIESEMKRLHCD